MKLTYALLLNIPFVALAQPWEGLLYGQGSVSQSFHSYSCNGLGERLNCEFNQITLRRKLTEENYVSERRNMLTNFQKELDKKGAKVAFDELCSGYVDKQMKPIIKGIKNKDLGSVTFIDLSQRSDESLARLLTLATDYSDICRQYSENWMNKFVDLTLQRDLETCSISTNRYQMTFQKTAKDVYTGQIGPAGSCGVVTIGIFSASEFGSSLWNYREERVVTNPDGEGILISCDDLEQQPDIKFSWRPVDDFRNCVYIN